MGRNEFRGSADRDQQAPALIKAGPDRQSRPAAGKPGTPERPRPKRHHVGVGAENRAVGAG